MITERRKKLLEYIEEHGETTLADLMALFPEYSAMTLRRDLKLFESEGYILRTYGGGVIFMQASKQPVEDEYTKREHLCVQEKKTIAEAAMKYITKGSSLFLDSGSTAMEVARLLSNEPSVVVTTGANTALELLQNVSCEIICLGGCIKKNTLSFSGVLAETMLDNINIGTALMATSGFSMSSGFTCGSFDESRIKRKVIAKAEQTIMLMDMSKVGKVMPFTFADLRDIDVIITNRPLPKEFEAEIHDLNLQVIVAE